MFTKRINNTSAFSAQFEGTAGVYAKRASPPQIPATIERMTATTLKKDSRSLSNVSLIRNRVDSSTQQSDVAAISFAFPSTGAASFENAEGNIAEIRRLSHTPQQRKAAPRHELSSHSFNVPHSSYNMYHPNNLTQRRYGKPASLENARNSQEEAQFGRGRIGPSISFGNFVEPLILPPIAHQSVYTACRNPSFTTKNQWQQQNKNFELNFVATRDSAKLDLDRLPPDWEVGITADRIRYYIDHKNGRTHWIHPLAPENLPLGWTKIFDSVHGVVYYNHAERHSQFEHPGFAHSTLVAPMLPTIHGSALLQSAEDEQQEMENNMISDVMGEKYIGKINDKEEKEEQNCLENIINNEDVPEWLKLYSQAPFSSDHLLNFNLFKPTHLEIFDRMIMKLYKAEIVNSVQKYDRAMSEIDNELTRR